VTLCPSPQTPARPAAGGRVWIVAGLLAAFGLALGIRALRFEFAFPEDGVVQFAFDDASYHVRRALYSFVNFPSVLTFDPYIAYPDGAPVPIPPLYDWLLAAVARLFGDSVLAFERVAAWASPVLSALTVVPIYAIGRRLGGPAVGLGAAFLFALLPASSNRSGVGNPDHHAAVALLAACWLASLVAEAMADRGSRPRLPRVILHSAVMAAMMLVWSGSLLYLILGEGARLVASAVVGRHPDRLLAQSGSALLAAGLIAPWLAHAGSPLGGPFSTTELSWMHFVVALALALLCGGLAALERFRPQPVGWRRASRAAALGLLIALPLLSLDALREPLTSGTGFLAKQDVWAESNAEQQPLFASSPGKLPATRLFGWYAFLIPLVPLLVVLRARGNPPEVVFVMLVWTTALGLLTLGQVRYAMDFAVAGSVIFAWALVAARNWVAPRLPRNGRFATGLVLAVGLALLWPALEVHGRRLGGVIDRALASAPRSRAGLSSRQSAVRFAEEVRGATPETAGFLEPGVLPEYGLLVPPTLGHLFVYVARRPVAANNMGPYLDAEKFHEARRFFFEVDSEAEALAIAERLGTRFLVSRAAAPRGPQHGAFVRQLHHRDGAATDGRPHLERFRLVTEGPRRGRQRPRRRQRPVPYKLFERVEGAVLEARGAPGELLEAEVPIVTPLGRSFRFRAVARADPSGTARVRVPYATDASTPVRPVGPYTVRFADDRWRIQVPDAAVREGRVLGVPPAAGADEAAGSDASANGPSAPGR